MLNDNILLIPKCLHNRIRSQYYEYFKLIKIIQLLKIKNMKLFLF